MLPDGGNDGGEQRDRECDVHVGGRYFPVLLLLRVLLSLLLHSFLE